MAAKCKAINSAGEPCSAQPLRGGDYCVWHSPELASDRHDWRVAGGLNKSNDARAKKRLKRLGLDDVDAAMCGALLDVLSGELEPGIATAAATVARAITQIRAATEIEQRIAALEQAQQEAQRWRA